MEAREYRAALKLNPENSDAFYALAENLVTRGLYKQAIEAYEKVISIDPEDAEAYYKLGAWRILRTGKKNRAVAIYPRLKTLDTGSAWMLKRLTEGR